MNPPQRATPPRNADFPLYLAEAFTSLSATWFSTGLYFITSSTFGWGTTANLALGASQGAVYVVGSLLASSLSARFGRMRLLVKLYAAMAALVLACGLIPGPVPFVVLLLVWTLLCAFNWPVLEGLLCHGSTAEQVSRRVGAYNLIWAATSALAVLTISLLMATWPLGVFVASATLHAASAVLVQRRLRHAAPAAEHAHLHAPPELLAKRELAKRLSRLALPASYTVIYSLTPLLVALPAVAALPESWRSPAISLWLVVRVFTFATMGATTFWHSRPGLLLGAVVAMAAAFAAAILTPAPLPGVAQLLWLLAAQAVLGIALGLIYAGSLYFGMVLSHGGDGRGGSTEQGGYHEALIGAGTVLGPAAGVAAAGLSIHPALGVGVVVSASVAACTISAAGARAARLRESTSDRRENTPHVR